MNISERTDFPKRFPVIPGFGLTLLPFLSSRTCVFMADERARHLHLLKTLTPTEGKARDYILRLLEVIGVYNWTQNN